MSSLRRITLRSVDSMTPGETLWDSDVKGFGVRCQGRARIYVLKARINGRQRWFTIGDHGAPWTPETARFEAQRLWGEIRSGVNLATLRDAKRDQATIGELCDRYLRDHAREHKKPSSIAADERNIANHLKPLLGHLIVTEISRSDVEDFKRKVRSGYTARKVLPVREGGRGGSPVTGGTGAANRCISLLSKMLNLAEEWGWRAPKTNPCFTVARYRENPSQRFLSSAEIERLGATLDAFDQSENESPYATAAIRLLLLTGARSSEIVTLKWSSVDLERSSLLLPDSKTGQKVIYLNVMALEVLRGIRPQQGNPYVIVGAYPGRHLTNLQSCWRRVRRSAGMEDVRLHDLRHSFASIAAANGASLPMIGKLLGHSTPLTTQRYAHLVADPIRDVAEGVGGVVSKAFRKER